MIKEITVGELKKMTDKEGLILQGCGGFKRVGRWCQ